MQNRRTRHFSYTLLLIAALHFLVYTTFIPGNHQDFLLRECKNTKQVSVAEIERIQRGPFESNQDSLQVSGNSKQTTFQEAAAQAALWRSQREVLTRLFALQQKLATLVHSRSPGPGAKGSGFAASAGYATSSLAKGRRFASSPIRLGGNDNTSPGVNAAVAAALVLLPVVSTA